MAGNDSSEQSERWLSTTLEEYKSLRQESLQALAQQQTVLQFGLSVLGVLVGLAVQQADKEPLLSIILGAGFVPLVAVFVAIIWVGEFERLGRVGFHLATIEYAVTKEIGRPALWWESALQAARGPYRRLRGRYRAVMAMLGLFALAGAVVGNVVLGGETSCVLWVALLSAADLLAIALGAVWFQRQFRRVGRFGSAAHDLVQQQLADLPEQVKAMIDRVETGSGRKGAPPAEG
jgi:hypothetical protein